MSLLPTKATLSARSIGRYALGLPGSDNRIAYELRRDGALVRNPCGRVVAMHVHMSNVRNYDMANPKDKVPPPYSAVEPQN